MSSMPITAVAAHQTRTFSAVDAETMEPATRGIAMDTACKQQGVQEERWDRGRQPQTAPALSSVNTDSIMFTSTPIKQAAQGCVPSLDRSNPIRTDSA